MAYDSSLLCNSSHIDGFGAQCLTRYPVTWYFMVNEQRRSWRPGKRDALFLAIVAAVILLLVLGSSDRTTRPVPNNETHKQATSRAACMACHDSSGIRPQPKGHTKADQCFQCHTQPQGWGKGQ